MEWTNTSLARLLIRDIFLLAERLGTGEQSDCVVSKFANWLAICKLYALTQLSGSKAVAAPDQE